MRIAGDSLSRVSRLTADPAFTFGSTSLLNFAQKSSTSQGMSNLSSKTVTGSVMPWLVTVTVPVSFRYGEALARAARYWSNAGFAASR